jgi:hypothetical protein
VNKTFLFLLNDEIGGVFTDYRNIFARTKKSDMNWLKDNLFNSMQNVPDTFEDCTKESNSNFFSIEIPDYMPVICFYLDNLKMSAPRKRLQKTHFLIFKNIVVNL